MSRSRLALATATALGVVVLLAGCVSSTPAPVPTASHSAPSSATATSAPAQVFDPKGSAKDNKAYFDQVNNKLFAANGSANGRDIVDNLVSAGFDKTDMQVTPDKSSINGAVDSILFSVKIGTDCLLGQHGSGGYSSAVEAALKDGSCLVGKTRPIDW